MRVELQRAESLVVLGEELHYGRAATRPHMSSPTLSRRIQRLERQHGATLLARGATGVLTLTPAGVQALRHFGALLALESDLREAARHPRTTLVLGVPDDGHDERASAHHAVTLQHLVQRDDTGARNKVRRVPLPLIPSWLLDAHVDVQVLSGVVCTAGVRSTSLTAVDRLLAVPDASRFADADRVDLAEAMELPLLYDLSLPQEFMAPFWLGDLRPPLARASGPRRRPGQQDGVRAHRPKSRGHHPCPSARGAARGGQGATRAGDRRASLRSLVRALAAVPPVADHASSS